MVLGIIMTVLGIFGIVVFLYLAYKTAKTPIENEKDKVIRLLERSKNININKDFNLNKNASYLDDVPDETSYLFEEDDRICQEETDLLIVEDDSIFYEDEETDLLDEETEYLEDDETVLL